MPLSIARSNVLWYNRAIFAANGIKPADLQTFSGWEAAARKLQAVGITPLAFGNTEPWVTWQLFECVLVGTLGPAKYAGLWNGETDWRGPEVKQALQNFQMMLQYATPNHGKLDWNQAYSLLIQRQAGMYVMGDWMVGEFSNSGFGGYGWTTPPGTAGAFVLWPDSFSLPAGTQDPAVAKEFLAYLGSRQAQEYFNRNRGLGTICARTDCDYSQFGSYNRASAADLQADTLVPSIARAMAVSEDWTAGFASALQGFLQDHNLAAAQSDLDSACRATKICQ
jgi:glucose/mannose transport system substrate-binding protein